VTSFRKVLGSDGRTVYYVDDAQQTCTCRGFAFRRRCKHLTPALLAPALSLDAMRSLVVAARPRAALDDYATVRAAGATLDDWEALGCPAALYPNVARVVAKLEPIARRPLPETPQMPSLAKGVHHWSCTAGACECGGTGRAPHMDEAMGAAGWR
jgi:hypothetical protein